MKRYSLLICVLLGTAAAAADDSPQLAQRGTTVDHLFGVALPDPYRWMEGAHNAAFETWLKSQAAAGRARLDAAPALAKWRKRLVSASLATVSNSLQQRVGNRIFYLRLESGTQGVLHVRMADGRDKVLFNPNLLKGAAHASITGYSVSPGGSLIAVNIDRGGQEITQVEFFNVDSGAKIADSLDRIWGELTVSWRGQTGVFYTQMAPPGHADPLLNMRIRYHELGKSNTQDLILARSGSNPVLAIRPQEFISVSTDPSSDWAVISISGARAEVRLCAVRVADFLRPAPHFDCVVDYDDGVQESMMQGNDLYLVSFKGNSNGRVLKLDMSRPGARPSTAAVVLAQDPQWIVTGMNVAMDGLYVERTRAGISGVVRIDGKTSEGIVLPFEGSIALSDSSTRHAGMIFALQGWTRPKTLYAYDPPTRTLADLKLGATSARDYAVLVDTETATAKSLDGTLVPVTLLKPKGFQRNAGTLAIVKAYGAYGTSIDVPAFDPMQLEWVAAGNLFVIAAIRGGGENGDAWRLAGKGMNKHHGIEDMVAAADALTTKGYADTRHIALYSASAGGIVIGGAIDRFPDHFGAAISHAGMLNPTRLAAGVNGANQYAEFGDPGTPDGFKSLYEMDAYLNLRPQLPYPAVLLDLGLNDSRVEPWNSGKFGAALMAATTSTQPVMFRADGDSGHFGTSLNQRAGEFADYYTFLEMTLGPAAQK